MTSLISELTCYYAFLTYAFFHISSGNNKSHVLERKKNTHTHKGALPKKMQDVSSKNIGTLDIFPRRPQKNQKLI